MIKLNDVIHSIKLNMEGRKCFSYFNIMMLRECCLVSWTDSHLLELSHLTVTRCTYIYIIYLIKYRCHELEVILKEHFILMCKYFFFIFKIYILYAKFTFVCSKMIIYCICLAAWTPKKVIV